MAWRIFKYSIGPGRGYVTMPAGARVLSVQMQGGDMRVWAHIDEDRMPVRYAFFVAGTGHKLPDDLPPNYAGTVQMDGGALVWHVFTDAEVVK